MYDAKNHTWTSKDGVTIKVTDMTTSHLRNAIRILDDYIEESWQVEVIENIQDNLIILNEELDNREHSRSNFINKLSKKLNS